ncbi:MAG: PD40 domain-containing protein [Planctomycetes bacterium]|nr:PD40 domain-containing protein [Planctomycetota bacterium]
MSRRRRWLEHVPWTALLAAAAIAAGLWLAVRAGLVRRVYVYGERGATLEVEGAPVVRSVSWSAPREVPRALAAPALAPAASTAAVPSGPPVSPGLVLTAERVEGCGLEIVARELTTSGWSAPAPLPEPVSSPHDELAPCLAPGGGILLFASDRPGGLGGLDLWLSRRGPGGWEEPASLGPRVNSPYDDSGPALHPGGSFLLFATNRPRSFLHSPPAEWSDVILSGWKAGDWEIALVRKAQEGPRGPRWAGLRLAEALASAADDVDPAFAPSGDFLYFASARPGGLGGLDLHRARCRAPGDEAAGTEDLHLEAPEPAGRPINSKYDDRAPWLFLDGSAIAYVASVPGTGVERLFESRTREVGSELALASIPLRTIARSLVRLAVLLGSGAALAAILVLAIRYRHAFRLNLLARCAIAAVLVHAAMLYGFYFWVVTDEIVALAERHALTEVTVEKVLQAKLTLEAARFEVRTPDAAPLAASPPAPAARLLARPEPAGEAPESSALAVFTPPARPAWTASPSAAQPALARPAPTPSSLAMLELPAALPAPRSAEALPVPEPALEADPSEAAPSPASPASPVSLKAGLDVPRPGPPAALEEVLWATPPVVDGASPAEVSAVPAATQVRIPEAPARFLPPLARPALEPPPEAPALPAPSRASEPEPAGPGIELAEPSLPAGRSAPQELSVAGGTAHVPGDGGLAPALIGTAVAVALDPSFDPSHLAPRDPTVPGLEPDLAPPPARVAPVPALAVAAAPARLPEPLAAPGAGDDPSPGAGPADLADLGGLEPRPASRLSSPGPLVPGPLAAETPPGDPGAAPPGARPVVALADSISALAAASSARLESAPRPGVLAAEGLPPLAHAPATAPASLPEGEGGSGLARASGAPEVTDLLRPSLPPSRAAPPREPLPPDPSSPEPDLGLAGGVTAGTVVSGSVVGGSAAEAPRVIRPGPGPPAMPPPADPGRDRDLVARAEVKLPEAPPELQGETDLTKVRSTAARKALVGVMGGTQASEDAVFLALRWLARHQSSDGRWDIDGFDAACQGCSSPGFQVRCDAAVTGLALLCFLGQNHTPANAESPFRKHAKSAIDWLLSIQEPGGSLAGEDARYTMYSHGILTLALSEAYTLTRDPRLAGPVRRAVGLIVRAQHPTTGGWRYRPEPPIRGDTSITGWQVLALVSARQGGIEVPERVLERARHWLDFEVSSGRHGGIYGYTRPEEPRVAMVAEGMFARLLLGARRTDPNIEEAARYLYSETRGGGHLDNLYLLYYGNLALYHYQGWIWESWNEDVREFLVRTQHRQGQAAGSWDPTGPWSETGGRVLATAFATLCLEVYYRYLPLYWSLEVGGR